MISRAALAAFSFALLTAAPARAQMPQPLPAEVLKEEVDPVKAAYLRAHEVASGPVVGGLSFRFPQAFYRSRLILLGESHGSAAPQVLDLELLTHLNAKIGLRDYLAEVDPIQAEFLNRHLLTGDEAPLNRVFSRWRARDQWGNTAFLAKVKAIRALNARLPADRRVVIHGVDAVQDWPLLSEWMTAEGATLDPAALEAEEGESGKARLALAALERARPSPLRERVRAGLEQTAAKSGREATIFAAVRTSVGQDFKPDDPHAPTAAYVQYVGVFRGSDWAPPLP